MTDMKKTRFTDEQIIGFLRQAEAGMPIKDICRAGGFSQPTFYKWRSRFGGMEASDAANLLASTQVLGRLGGLDLVQC
jgi:putative transposase